MKNYLKKNKYTIIILSIIFIIFTYCSLNCFPINDDLPYSFYYRSSTRITNIVQIIRNQLSDYLTINGRFVVHSVVQFMLMFNRYLFSVVNSICLVTSFVFIKKILDLILEKTKIKKELGNIYIYFLIIGLFLLMGNLKYLIYWIAGSVNYIWVFTLLLIFTYYYLKEGLFKYKRINGLIVFSLSILHECSFAFVLFILIGDLIYNFIKNKKIENVFLYVFYIVLSIIGGLIIIKSPGNLLRMSNSTSFYNMSLIDRFSLTIPVVSKNIFNISNINNLLPLIYVMTFSLVLIINKDKILKSMGLLLIPFLIVLYLANNGWLYFALAILIFIVSIYHNYKLNNDTLSVILLAIYAVVFSMIITPEYRGARPNYYIYLYMILMITFYLNILIRNKILLNIIKIISILLFITTVIYEVNIYNDIGKVKNERLEEINRVKKNNLKVLKYKRIKDKYAKYHADANCPDSNEYWAFRYFTYYYDLPIDIEIKLVD